MIPATQIFSSQLPYLSPPSLFLPIDPSLLPHPSPLDPFLIPFPLLPLLSFAPRPSRIVPNPSPPHHLSTVPLLPPYFLFLLSFRPYVPSQFRLEFRYVLTGQWVSGKHLPLVSSSIFHHDWYRMPGHACTRTHTFTSKPGPFLFYFYAFSPPAHPYNQEYKSEKWPVDRHFRFHDPRYFARVTFTEIRWNSSSPLTDIYTLDRSLFLIPFDGGTASSCRHVTAPGYIFSRSFKSRQATSTFSRMQLEKVGSVTRPI